MVEASHWGTTKTYTPLSMSLAYVYGGRIYQSTTTWGNSTLMGLAALGERNEPLIRVAII